jgi:pimeloyl-ACP methyl ester carboxylesterase
MGKLFRLTARLFGAACLLAFLALLGLRAAAAIRETAGARPPANGRQVVTAAGGIFVQSRGPESGPPVVFVAGTAAWSGFWLSITETVGRAGYRATAIDLPPFGFSERSASGAYSRVDQAERLRALVAALGLKRPTIVGHSFGAGAVVEYAFRYPEEIGAMVLVDAALGLPEDEHPPAADPALLRWALDQPVVAQALTAATLVNVWATRTLLAGLLYRKEAATTAVVEILTAPLYREGATEAYAQWLPNLLLPETRAISATPANFAGLTTPTALIWGARDSVTPLVQGERLHTLIRGSTLETIADVGHIPHIEDEQAFSAVLKARLALLTQH